MAPEDTTSHKNSTRGEFFVVINPGSGEHDLSETHGLLERVFGEAGQPFSFVHIADPAELESESVAAAARALACDGALVAVGGDGTINAVARAAWEKGCKMGALPQGTFNYFGRANGISQDLETAARALLRAQEGAAQAGLINGRLFLVNA
ncbi:MAG: diacylglycerol kinase, partial [Comamonadaceae bacterium]